MKYVKERDRDQASSTMRELSEQIEESVTVKQDLIKKK